MDILSVAGVLAIIGLATFAVMRGEITSVFLNWHGISLVLGGTVASTLINTPIYYARAAVASLIDVFRTTAYENPRTVLPVLISLCEQVRGRGINALRDADPSVAGGFLAKASQIALEYNNVDYVRHVLETEIDHVNEHYVEVVNVFRTMAVLAPMFGLIGTLIGIVGVLREISDPSRVGQNMSVAITTAFYGILFANLFCVPVAGKLRVRYGREVLTKTMIKEAVVLMMQGTVPLILERRLESLLAQ